jgi:hypothetical protein
VWLIDDYENFLAHCLGWSRDNTTRRPTFGQIEAWRIFHVNRPKDQDRWLPKPSLIAP